MLKILIVDDEYQIREGMRSFPWEQYGCEIAGFSEDGEEALLKSRLLQPDIVITDIKMQGMDGLTFAEELKKESPLTGIILLTGFDEAAYARRAVHIHVDDYLLKPASAGDLAASLEKVCSLVRVRQNREQHYEKLNRQIEAALPLLRSNLFSRLANGTFHSAREAERSFSLFDVKTGKYAVIGLKYSLKETSGSDRIREEWMHMMSIGSACEKEYAQYTLDLLSFSNNPSLYYLLIFPAEWTAEDCGKAIQMSTHKVKKQLKADLDFDLSFGISRISSDLMGVAELYYQANYALSQCSFFSDNPTLYYNDLSEEGENEIHIPAARREELITAINSGDYTAVSQYVEYLIPPSLPDSVPDITASIQRVMSEVFYVLQQTEEVAPSEVLKEGFRMDLFQELLHSHSQKELRDCAAAIMGSVLQAKQKKTIRHFDVTANQIVAYIREHYQEDLSLDLLADRFHFSTSYISRLIRRCEGINFTEIVTETRLQKAKQLLEDPSLRTLDVGSMVGYHDTSYFIQSFRKRFGVTPNEYRGLMAL